MTTAHPPHPNGTAKWQLFASLGTVGVALIAAFIGLLLTINGNGNSIISLSEKVTGLEKSLQTVTETQQARGQQITALRTAMREIETQFCAEDAMRNLMHANDLRQIAMLWRKVYDVEFPTANAYYPKIGQCGQEIK